MANIHRCFFLALVICILGSSECARPTSSVPEWLKYWQQNLPLVRAPVSLEKLSSPMTTSESTKYLKALEAGSLAAQSQSFCKAGHLLCDEKKSSGSGQGPVVCVAPYFYEYKTAKCKGHAATMSDAVLMSDVFFEPSKLSSGNRIVYPKLANDLQGRNFLPASLAKAMPFSSNKLSESFALLNVPSDSNMAQSMQETVLFCSSKPPQGEVRTCHSSIESMVDFAVSNMGTKLAVFSPESTSTKSEQVKVLNIASLSNAQQKSMTCHDLMYPYLVYGCHVMGASQILDVELGKEDGSSFHGVAVCHTDTSAWNEGHPAFAALGVKPGESTICHWMPQNNLVWILSPY